MLRIFSDKPPTSLRDSEAEIREMMTGTPGFRAYSVIDTPSGGASLVVCDDKAGTDKIGEEMRALVRSKFPDFVRTPPEIIEGTGVFRLDAADVPAAPA